MVSESRTGKTKPDPNPNFTISTLIFIIQYNISEAFKYQNFAEAEDAITIYQSSHLVQGVPAQPAHSFKILEVIM